MVVNLVVVAVVSGHNMEWAVAVMVVVEMAEVVKVVAEMVEAEVESKPVVVVEEEVVVVMGPRLRRFRVNLL